LLEVGELLEGKAGDWDGLPLLTSWCRHFDLLLKEKEKTNTEKVLIFFIISFWSTMEVDDEARAAETQQQQGLSAMEMASIAAALGEDDPALAHLVAAARGLQLQTQPGGGAILVEERGRGHILEQAQADGSSFVCDMCHGIVATRRRVPHVTQWCPALPSSPMQRD
jgi:hypothetical protein